MRHLLIPKFVDKIARAGSLRKAAQQLRITPSALNRRILSIEEELGVEIFERHPTGLKPNAAGEIILKHFREQIADMERVKSTIADISGMRAGHVNIGITSELTQYFIPEMIKQYSGEFPAVSFSLEIIERDEIDNSLANYSNDIALIFAPTRMRETYPTYSGEQKIYAIMDKNHKLVRKKSVKIYDCVEFPLFLPNRNSGIREILEKSAQKMGIELRAIVESNSFDLLRQILPGSDGVGFLLEVNLPPKLADENLRPVRLETPGVAPGILITGHLRARVLPVAASRFLENINRELAKRFG